MDNRSKAFNYKYNHTKHRGCLNCDKEIYNNNKTGYCRKCYFEQRDINGEKNPNYGNHPMVSKETRLKHGLSQLGTNNHSYVDGRYSKDYFCKDCNKPISTGAGIYGKGRCGSCSQKENYKNYGQRGKIGTSKAGYYCGNFMKSSWEIKFARFLTLSRVKWTYEPKIFYLGNTTYTPDFYLPDFDCYVEIKGWWRDNSKKKVQLFIKHFPAKHLKIFRKKDLLKLGVL